MEIRLDNVLYVPDLECNLLSVQACVNNGCSVTFEKNIFTIEKNKIVIADGKTVDGLYYWLLHEKVDGYIT